MPENGDKPVETASYDLSLANKGSGLAGGGGNTGGLLVEQWDRKVKYYKLTESEVSYLGTLNVLSSILYATGGTAVGFYANLKMSLVFSTTPLPLKTQALIDVLSPLSFWAGIIFLVTGVGLAIFRACKFKAIKIDHVQDTGNATI
jgi:hypothetical protein